jgi:transposase
VLRTGIQWKALPKEYGVASSIHQYFSEWAEAGFFQRMWQEGLIACDELKGLGWEWQSADGRMVKAPLAREARGKRRRETRRTREKRGTKRSMAAESHGLPVSEVLDRANLCLDAGYTGSQKTAEDLWYKARIRGRGEERDEKENKPDYVARRWVVETCHSWLNRFRKLFVRYEKKSRNYLALAEFVCAVIVWRNVIHVHPGLISR